MSEFVHLNVASAFSGHYGVNRPESLVQAAANSSSALAITDRDGLYGAVKHIAACLKAGISPIIGANLSVSEGPTELARCVILAHGNTSGLGWATLCAIVSKAGSHKGKTRRASIQLNELAQLAHESSGCTVLLTADSNVGRATLSGNKTESAKLLAQWQMKFGNRLVLEIVSHLTEPGTAYSTIQARRLLALADELGIACALTNSVRYLEPDDAITADVLDSARFLEPLGAFEPQPNAQAWLKPANLMQQLALEITNNRERAHKLLNSTTLLANRCRLDPVTDCGWGQTKTPEKSALGITGNPFEVLTQKVNDGVGWRYPNAKPKLLAEVTHRLNQELITIHKLGFATYFLTVADVVQMIRDMKVRVAARGSGAGSLVNYLLGIGGVDPIENELLFERFLSTERSTLPDIDIDVESARRHDIYRNIFKRYGSHRVTLLSMQSTYRGRGAARDSGLALGLEEEQIDEIAKSMWRFSARSFRSALGSKPELAQFAELVESDRRANLLVDITERLDRLPRHISVHPCGVILGDQTLLQRTSVEPSGMGLPMSQFDKDDMDPMGMLKLDVLGVRMQSAIAYTVQQIEKVHNKSLDLDAVPRDDAATFATINTTNTLGLFQIESPGQRELTGKHQPTKFNDLTIQISLFRPGPMKGNMIAPYLDGRQGFSKPVYPHPDLQPILKETFGVVIFHEHVLRIFNKMTGCGLAKADELRRSLEDYEKAPLVEKFYREKSAANGYDQTVIDKVWKTLESFGSFGFCKAHGAAFALPTYQSAWLKTHYPTEFMAGLFTHDPGMYPKRLLASEARRLGVELLPIDINLSNSDYQVEKTAKGTYGVRMALTDIAGMSEAEQKRIIENRPYKDIRDLYERATPSKRTLKNLALIGALDSLAGLEHTRGDIVARVNELAALKNKPKLLNHPQLDFELIDHLPSGNPEPSPREAVQNELAITKVDISQHELEQYQPMLEQMGVVHSDELVTLRNKTEVLVAGVRVATQTPPIRSGKRIVFVSLDDGTGCSDSTFFEDAQQRCSNILFNNRLLLISGKTRRTGIKGVSIVAENAWDLKELWRNWVASQGKASA